MNIAERSTQLRRLILFITCAVALHTHDATAQSPNNLRTGLESLAADTVLRRNDSAIQTFHISKSRKMVTEEYLFIYWPEAHRIFQFASMAPENELWLEPLLAADNIVDLESHIVASEEDVGGSTYLQTAAWAEDIIADCLAGDVMMIRTLPEPE